MDGTWEFQSSKGRKEVFRPTKISKKNIHTSMNQDCQVSILYHLVREKKGKSDMASNWIRSCVLYYLDGRECENSKT